MDIPPLGVVGNPGHHFDDALDQPTEVKVRITCGGKTLIVNDGGTGGQGSSANCGLYEEGFCFAWDCEIAKNPDNECEYDAVEFL